VDKEFCEKMYNTYFMQVFSYVMTLSGSRDIAGEIAQETFYRVLASPKGGFRGESEEMTWLCAIAKNIFLDEKRKQSRHKEVAFDETIDEENTEVFSNAIENREADQADSYQIHMIFHQLEEPYKEVFELRVFGELTFAQIGKIFGKTENWARVTYHRAKLKIQERMNK